MAVCPRAVLILSLLPLAACSHRLNTTDIEAEIKADIERQGRRLLLREVRCPDNIIRQAESYFRCVGELKPQGTFAIDVVQQDNQGSVEWTVPNSTTMLNLALVEATIQEGLLKALGQPADVDCGSEAYRPNQPGDRFECQVVGGLFAEGSQIDSVLVTVETDGNLTWQERRQQVQPPTVTPPAVEATPGTTPVPSAPEGASTSVSSPPVKTASVAKTGHFNVREHTCRPGGWA